MDRETESADRPGFPGPRSVLLPEVVIDFG